MTTYADLKTRTLRRLIDAPASVIAEVPLIVNDVYTDLQRDHRFWESQATLAVSTTEGSHVLASTPSDWGSYRGSTGWYVTELGDSRRIVLGKGSQEAAIRWNNVLDIGEPRYVTWVPSGLQVFPLPDGNADWEDGEYRVNVPYWSRLPALAADADQTWLTDLASDYLIAEATRRGFLLDWDEQRAQVWATEASTFKRELMLADKLKWLDGAEPMVPYPDVFQPKIPE